MSKESISVKETGLIIGLGVRTVYRLRDGGKMPQPLRIGGSVRWRRAELEAWIADGCSDVRRTGWRMKEAA